MDHVSNRVAKKRPGKEDAADSTDDDKSAPWLDKDGNVIWSRQRIVVCKCIDHHFFECFMSLIIVFNIALIILETDEEARCYPKWTDDLADCPFSGAKQKPWITVVNNVLLTLYTVEAFLRIYVERRAYLSNNWNRLDFFIVFTGWGTLIAGSIVNMSFLRFFRIARLARVLRVFIAIRELYMLLSGFLTAVKTIIWGAIMMFGMLLLWSILMVEFVHPTNSALVYDGCERCDEGLATVFDATLTLFQTIVAGDSWGQIAIPCIEENPMSAVLFIAALLTVSLGLTNLILSVIVDRAAEARERDVQDRVKQKEIEQEQQKAKLLELCKKMDIDEGGTLCLTELLQAYDEMPEFKSVLQLMDIEREELKAVMKVLDVDGSGDVSYTEFCDQLHQIRTRDTRTMLTFMKLSINELKEQVEAVSAKELAFISREVQENTSMLQVHSKLLESIDDRLRKLDLPSLLESHSQADKGHRGAFGGAGGARSAPVLPPQPWAAPDRPVSAQSVLEDIHSLGTRTHELAGLKGIIVRRVEDQVAMLTRQAGHLATISVSVKSGTRLPETGLEGLEPDQLGRIGDKLARIQENLHRDLTTLLQDVDQRLEDGAATLARNNELLASLSNDLGCQLPPLDIKQRGLIEEGKARGRPVSAQGQSNSGWTICNSMERNKPDGISKGL